MISNNTILTRHNKAVTKLTFSIIRLILILNINSREKMVLGMKSINLTTQRRAVYDVVKNASDHPTAAEVMNRLVEQGYNFAYGTVYNSLRYLTDKELIRELKLGEAASRYDAKLDDHQHILCEVCGRVDEVMTQVPDSWSGTVAIETGYKVHHAHVVFGGVCPECQEKK